MSRNKNKNKDVSDQQKMEIEQSPANKATPSDESKGDGKSSGKDWKPRRRGKGDPKYRYNNLAFYVHNPEMLKNIAQLSFQNFLGASAIGQVQIPTMCIISLNPSPGVTYAGSTPALSHPSRTGINISTLNLFNRLAMKSGRTMQYAPQDIAMLELQLGQLYSTFSYIRRIFGLRNCYQSYNRMFPQAIIENLGIDYSDFIKHYADYRDYINSEIDRLNQLPMLMNTGYLMKCMTQFEYVFKDSDSPLSQVYAFVPATPWVIAEDAEIQGTRLETIPFCSNLNGTRVRRTMEWVIEQILRPMIDALLTSSTFNLIYADLLNLASKDSTLKFFTFSYINAEAVVEPIHNYEALLHIHNLTTINMPALTEDKNNRTCTKYNDVICDPDNNSIVYNPGFYKGANTVVPQMYTLLDAGTANPSDEIKVEMSRYKSILTNNFLVIDEKKYFVYAVLTDWYAVYMNVYRAGTMGTAQSSGFLYTDLPAVEDWNEGYITALSQFDWHPICTKFDSTIETGLNATTLIYGDLDFTAVVGIDYLERLNNQIYVGLFQWL